MLVKDIVQHLIGMGGINFELLWHWEHSPKFGLDRNGHSKVSYPKGVSRTNSKISNVSVLTPHVWIKTMSLNRKL